MAVAFVAIEALLLRASDLVAAAGLLMAAAIMRAACRSPQRGGGSRRRSAVRWGGAVVACVVGWVALVDRSEALYWCADCSDHRWVSEHRFAGVAVWSQPEDWHRSYESRFRADLGVPCRHKLSREQLTRRWGLVVPTWSYLCLLCCVATDGDDPYDEQLASRVRRFATRRPDSAHTLAEQIAELDRFEEMHQLFTRRAAALAGAAPARED